MSLLVSVTLLFMGIFGDEQYLSWAFYGLILAFSIGCLPMILLVCAKCIETIEKRGKIR